MKAWRVYSAITVRLKADPTYESVTEGGPYVRIGGCTNNREPSSDSITHSPYIPRMVPIGMFMRFSADSTIVRIRAHGRYFSSPAPAMMPGTDRINMKTPSAT